MSLQEARCLFYAVSLQITSILWLLSWVFFFFFVFGSQWFDYDVSGKEFALSLPSLECTELLESVNARLSADLGYFFKYVLFALSPPLELCVAASISSFLFLAYQRVIVGAPHCLYLVVCRWAL